MEIKSMYLERYKEVLKYRDDGYFIRDNKILVEVIPEPERKTKTGIILSSNVYNQTSTIQADKPALFIVIDIGEGYSNDGIPNRDTMDLDIGDIIMIPKLSVKYYSTFGGMKDYKPDTLGSTREDSIEMRWKGIEAYYAYFNALNKGL